MNTESNKIAVVDRLVAPTRKHPISRRDALCRLVNAIDAGDLSCIKFPDDYEKQVMDAFSTNCIPMPTFDWDVGDLLVFDPGGTNQYHAIVGWSFYPLGWKRQPVQENVPDFVREANPISVANNRLDAIGGYATPDDPSATEYEILDCSVPVPGTEREVAESSVAVRVQVDSFAYARSVRTGEFLIGSRGPSYFARWVPKPHAEEHDICCYCGTSNGVNGELRNGYDCFYCGGN